MTSSCHGRQRPLYPITHWGRVTHISVGNLTIIGSDNGLAPGRRQAITWTNVGILLISPLGTNFSEMLIEIHTFSFKKTHLKMSSGKWRPFCLGLNVLNKQCHAYTADLATQGASLSAAKVSKAFGRTILPSARINNWVNGFHVADVQNRNIFFVRGIHRSVEDFYHK